MTTPGIRLPQFLVNPASVGIGTIAGRRYLCDRFLLTDLAAGLPLHRVPTADGLYSFHANGRTVRIEDHDPARFRLDQTWQKHTANLGPLVTWATLRVSVAFDFDTTYVLGRAGNRMVAAHVRPVEILLGRGFDLHVSTIKDGRAPLLVACNPVNGAPVALLQSKTPGDLVRQVVDLAALIGGAS